jgi:hypothetical protein
MMYQLEVKRYLIELMFNPSDGWNVIVDIDAMERAKGPQHKDGKKQRVVDAEKRLNELGVEIGVHPKYGRADVVASHPKKGTFLIEVEGKSSKQKEQAIYSALGQIVLLMSEHNSKVFYGLAVPDQPEWERQLKKVPRRVKELLSLGCILVSEGNVREI